MNYGYAPTPHDAILEQRLAALVAEDRFTDARGQQPYVERDRLYRGVRIRRITHLSAEQEAALTAAADAIYEQVTGRSKQEAI